MKVMGERKRVGIWIRVSTEDQVIGESTTSAGRSSTPRRAAGMSNLFTGWMQ